MSKDFSHIPATPVTLSDARDILESHGDKMSRENLRKYCHRHALIAGKVGRSLLIDPRAVANHRDNFSREVMAGEHLNRKTAPNAPASSPKPKLRLAAASPNPSPRAKPLDPSADPAEISSLDRARDAKAEKEEAQASAARLTLYRQTRDLVSTAEFEVTLGLLMSMIKESLFGVNLSDDTDAILAVNNLPDSAKKRTSAILKARRRKISQDLSELAAKEMAALDPYHAAEFRARMEHIVKDVHAARTAAFNRRLEGGLQDRAPA